MLGTSWGPVLASLLRMMENRMTPGLGVHVVFWTYG